MTVKNRAIRRALAVATVFAFSFVVYLILYS